jgi:AcrR family transcriptional regulator
MDVTDPLAPVNTPAYGGEMIEPLSRDRWTDAALAALSSEGLEAVRVEPLARRLHATKGSFYWHFRDRRDLFAAMLARWEQVATQAIIDQVEALTGSADARLAALFELALGAGIMDLEIALREWARREERVAKALKRVDGRRLGYLQRLFEEVGLSTAEASARAFLAYATLFGDHFIGTAERGPARRALLDRAAALLLATPSTPRAVSPRRRRSGG